MRRLHIKLALGFPVVVDVELNEVLATPDDFWQNFVHLCAHGADQALFLAERDGSSVGMGQVHRQAALARLEMLYVDGSVRRRGVGTALVEAQESWARASGITELFTHIPDTSAAGSLATELGWHRTEEVFLTRHGLAERKWTSTARSDQG